MEHPGDEEGEGEANRNNRVGLTRGRSREGEGEYVYQQESEDNAGFLSGEEDLGSEADEDSLTYEIKTYIQQLSYDEQIQDSDFDADATIQALGEKLKDVYFDFLSMSPDPFDEVDSMYGQGSVIEQLIVQADANFHTGLTGRYLFSENLDTRIAALRILCAVRLKHFPPQLEPEEVLTYVFELISSEYKDTRVWATGVLARIMKTRYNADEVAMHPVLKLLLARIVSFIRVNFGLEFESPGFSFDDSEREGATLSGASVDNVSVRENFYCLECIIILGEYQAIVQPVLEFGGIQLALLALKKAKEFDKKSRRGSAWANSSELLEMKITIVAILKFVAALSTHKKFATEFVDSKGTLLLLNIVEVEDLQGGVGYCFAAFASIVSVMEKICLMPAHVMTDIMKAAVKMISAGQESAKRQGALFIALCMSFRALLHIFDSLDGFRILINLLGKIPSPVFDPLPETFDITVNAAMALQRYFRMHLDILANEVRRRLARSSKSVGQNILRTNIPAYKCTNLDRVKTTENIELVYENLDSMYEVISIMSDTPFTTILKGEAPGWAPIIAYQKYNTSKLLFELLHLCNSYWRTDELALYILNVLEIITISPATHKEIAEGSVRKYWDDFEENFALREDEEMERSLVILLNFCEAKPPFTDVMLQRSALNVVVNFACRKEGRGFSDIHWMSNHVSDSSLKQIWEALRSSNGIKLLLGLLSCKTPVHHADWIRCLAARALSGMARSRNIAQILGKLQLSGQLWELMREPVLNESVAQHRLFCKAATELIAKITGKEAKNIVNDTTDMSRMEKASVVAETCVKYSDKELLKLIYKHLESAGLKNAAEALNNEAHLYDKCPEEASTPFLDKGKKSNIKEYSELGNAPLTSGGELVTPMQARNLSSQFKKSSSRLKVNISESRLGRVRTPNETPNGLSGPNTPLVSPAISAVSTPQRLQIQETTPSSIRHKCLAGSNMNTPHKEEDKIETVSLSGIVTHFLRDQHADCTHPVSTLPPFSLDGKHKCPEPKYFQKAPTNMASRVMRHQITPRFGGMSGRKLTRKLVYSRFRPLRSFRDDMSVMTCSAFVEDSLLVGTHFGDIQAYDTETGSQIFSSRIVDSTLWSIKPSQDSTKVLTSSFYDQSSLWNLNDLSSPLFSFPDTMALFSNMGNDRILGTNGSEAHIYSTETGQKLQTLKENSRTSHQGDRHSCASFNPSDDIVLCDSVLYDPLTGKKIHKFDKFTNYGDGVFHPSGLEIVINSEIWDMRTFKLLKYVPSLDQSQVVFNKGGDVMYGVVRQFEDERQKRPSNPYGSSFRTYDATDYGLISVVDLEKSIVHLSCDNTDNYIAVVENNLNNTVVASDSCCRLYEVGRRRPHDDDSDMDDGESDDEDGDEMEGMLIQDNANADDDDDLLAALDEFEHDADMDDAMEYVDEASDWPVRDGYSDDEDF
eukprot:Nk52_evm79s1444 gene=Nk52_evmTU79s1444